MKKLSLLSLILAAAIALGACGKSEQSGLSESEAAPAARSLLAHVPSNTPYLAANLQPMPDAVIDANFKRYEPVLAEIQSRMTQMKADIDGGGTVTGDAFTDRLLLAVLTEFDGKLSREGIESLGWDIKSSSALYGDGAFPVARIALSDPATLRATILRILENAGIEAPESEFQGVSYWRMAAPDSDEVPLALYVSVLDDHMALGVYPMSSEAGFLPSFLGIEMPKSDAAEKLAALNAEHGFTPFGSGFVDLHRMADEFLDADATTARAMMSIDGYDLENFSEQCVAEVHGMIDNMPSVTFGLTAVEAMLMEYDAVFEMPANLAAELAALVAPIPGAEKNTKSMVDLSFGIKVGAVRDFVREKAQAIVDAPYQCEQFADLNAQAQKALTTMDQPIPPFVNNFRGLRISLQDLVMGPNPEVPIPQDVSGMLAVHVEQPEMFVGMAQMFLPDLSGLNLAPGEPPVKIPESLLSFQGLVAYAAMSDNAIGMSVGDGLESGLGDYLEADAGPEGRLMTVDYDVAAYSEYQLKMLDNVQPDADGENAMIAISRVSLEANRDSGDRNRITLDFKPEGAVLKTRMSYK
jgi:hypothetical protein